MLRIFYITILLSLVLPASIASSSVYTVKLAIYENKKNLDKKLSTFSPAVRKTIKVEKNENVYKVQTLLTQNKNLLTKLLPTYKKVFPDAVIDTVASSKILQQSKIEEPDTFYQSLENTTLYLCPEHGKEKSKDFLIEVTFKESSVTYYPILGKIPPMSALYKIKDDKLFLYQKGLLNSKVFSILEKSTKKYHLISSWVEEKKVRNLRYYFNLDDAKLYLQLH